MEPSEARKAFAKLAYTKYKHLPLYLEWAPDNSFTTPPAKKNEITGVHTSERVENEKVEKQAEGISENVNETNKTGKEESEDEEEEEAEPDTTLFVKNINFATTEEQLNSVCYFTNIVLLL